MVQIQLSEVFSLFLLQPQSRDIATGDGQSLSAATNDPEGEVSLSAHVLFTVDNMSQLRH